MVSESSLCLNTLGVQIRIMFSCCLVNGSVFTWLGLFWTPSCKLMQWSIFDWLVLVNMNYLSGLRFTKLCYHTFLYQQSFSQGKCQSKTKKHSFSIGECRPWIPNGQTSQVSFKIWTIQLLNTLDFKRQFKTGHFGLKQLAVKWHSKSGPNVQISEWTIHMSHSKSGHYKVQCLDESEFQESSFRIPAIVHSTLNIGHRGHP